MCSWAWCTWNPSSMITKRWWSKLNLWESEILEATYRVDIWSTLRNLTNVNFEEFHVHLGNAQGQNMPGNENEVLSCFIFYILNLCSSKNMCQWYPILPLFWPNFHKLRQVAFHVVAAPASTHLPSRQRNAVRAGTQRGWMAALALKWLVKFISWDKEKHKYPSWVH